MPPRPPLLGYNNNVQYRGQIFHIQTEDSGVNSPRIMTHLFADGGRIVRSLRTDYGEHVASPEMAVLVKELMKKQHKEMFVSLRAGEFDDLIGFEDQAASASEGSHTSTPLAADGESSDAESAASLESLSSKKIKATPRFSSQQSASHRREVAESSLESSSFSSVEPGVLGPGFSTPVKPKGAPEQERAPSSSRPSAQFSVGPSGKGSLFGQVEEEEDTLDEVILSYLGDEKASKT
ncbi:MAG: hypothetical protein MK135_01045 [Polyangiaceae bacterium]|nr:hypothetical protein [Polyangiaceae bacterium]